MAPPRITHVVFDFDGVLIDSERQYSLANSQCLARYGKVFTLEMKAAMMGRKKTEAIELLLRTNGLRTDAAAVQEYFQHYDLLLEQLIPLANELAGASKLINHFHSTGTPLAICTGSDAEEFALKTRNRQDWLNKIPLQVLSGSDPEVRFGKPHPDPYDVTIRRFPLHYQQVLQSPENVIVFEDSVNGVKSALAAGLTTVMIPQSEFLPSNWDTEILPELEREPQLVEIIDSLEEFDPETYGLPAFGHKQL